ncbi:MAG TPA: hypothetical protein VH208_02470, partial [Myxococcaceae bacterium]|nr:hypothetical protein [Myxococcaceae bacterium]
LEVAAFGGKVKEPRTSLPERADDYKLGNTWAYLIDLLDPQGRIAFRIHYVDAASGPPHGIASKKLIAERDVDLHIACVPGFEQTDDYPGTLLERHHVKYVLMGHWEDFFQPRGAPLKPLRNVLDEASMGRFVKIVERALPEPRGVAPLTEPRGPHGKTWTLPVPGETFQFATAGHFE